MDPLASSYFWQDHVKTMPPSIPSTRAGGLPEPGHPWQAQSGAEAAAEGGASHILTYDKAEPGSATPEQDSVTRWWYVRRAELWGT